MHTEKLKCPHCERLHDPYDDLSAFPFREDADPEFNCWSCGKTFWVQTIVSVTWIEHATVEEYEENS